MFAMWADIARDMGVPTVMRDVTLWAFTLDFFREREDELAEFETAMAELAQPLHAYLGQLRRHPDPSTRPPGSGSSRSCRPSCSPARKTS